LDEYTVKESKKEQRRCKSQRIPSRGLLRKSFICGRFGRFWRFRVAEAEGAPSIFLGAHRKTYENSFKILNG
jgi:hypothetical protein